MSKFARYTLKNHNKLTPTLNWFNPASYSTTLSSFYGMPWEIFRTTSILPTSRPVTFVTKAGSHPGYYSSLIMLPEFDLGITILAAGSSNLKAKLIEMVTVPLVKAAEEVAQAELRRRYTGFFAAGHINSSISIAHTDAKALHIESLVSNSTDVLAAWRSASRQDVSGRNSSYRLQLIPTLLHRDKEHDKGEIWRGLFVPENPDQGLVWDDFCLTDDEMGYYGRKPLFEMVFWSEDDAVDEMVTLELSAFRVVLNRKEAAAGSGGEVGTDESRRGRGQDDVVVKKQKVLANHLA